MDPEDRPRSLSLPVRIGAVLIAALLVVPALVGVILTTSGSTRGGIIGGLAFVVFFGGIVGVLYVIRQRAQAERDHDKQWGPRPRPPG